MSSLSRTVGVLFLTALLLGGCDRGGSPGPQILRESAHSAPPDGSLSPSIDHELASQAGLERLIYHVGPVDLPPHTAAKEMLDHPLTMRFHVDQPVWVVGFEPKVVDAHGNELPSSLLHHAIVSNLHEDNPLCASETSGNPFTIANSMLTVVKLPEGYGYPLLPDDPIEASVILKNETDLGFGDVSYEITLITRPMGDVVDLKDVKPILIDFDPCTHLPIDIPPGELAAKMASYSLTDAGNLILAQGFLADYGVAVELIKGKEAMPFWRAEATLDNEHQIFELIPNPYEDPAGLPFAAGDAITLRATYNNFSTHWLHGASSGAMIYLAGEGQ